MAGQPGWSFTAFMPREGNIFLNWLKDPQLQKLKKKLIDLIPAKKVDPDKYFIQVRESQSSLVLAAGIILITLSGLCIIGGLVLGILAKQIFPG